jgi:Ca2+-binding RTX toxin-like protein
MQVAIKGVPEGFTLSAGTRNADGSWSVAQSDLGNVSINAPKDFNGQVNLTLEATTTESSNGEAAVVSKDFSVNVNAVPDAANVSVGNVVGLEDQAIKLDLAASLSDIDGSEAMQVAIKGVPEGFTLSAGTRNADGSWSVAQSDLGNVSINAPKDFNGQVNLTLEATTTESSNGETAVVSKDFSVDFVEVNDAPFDIQIDNNITVENVVPGELIATLSASDVDDSNLQYRISGENAKSFVIVGNELRISDNASFSFANRPVERLTIEVSDGRGGVTTKDIEIAISANSRTVEGTSGSDVLKGTSASDTILAGDGDDVMIGDVGADVLDGGEGSQDVVDYSKSSGAVNVNLDKQQGQGGDADGDTIRNVEGVIGSSFDDTLTGDKQDNLLVGNAGNDQIAGGEGNDLLIGGAGDDQLDGGTGTDVAKFSGKMSDYQFDRNADGQLVVTDLRPGSPDGVDRLVDVEVLAFADKSEAVGALFNSLLANQNQAAPLPSPVDSASIRAVDASLASDSVRSDTDFGKTVNDLESLTSELDGNDPIGLAAPEYENPIQYVTLPPVEKIDWSKVDFNDLVDSDSKDSNTVFDTSRTEANVSQSRSGLSENGVEVENVASTLQQESSTLSKLWALVRAYGGLRQK